MTAVVCFHGSEIVRVGVWSLFVTETQAQTQSSKAQSRPSGTLPQKSDPVHFRRQGAGGAVGGVLTFMLLFSRVMPAAMLESFIMSYIISSHMTLTLTLTHMHFMTTISTYIYIYIYIVVILVIRILSYHLISSQDHNANHDASHLTQRLLWSK